MNIFGLIELPTWALLLSVIAVLLYWYLGYTISVFERLEMPYVKTNRFVGTGFELFSKKTNVQTRDFENTKKFGKVYGLFMGRIPQVAVADPDIIKQIFVKDTHIYTNRQDFGVGNDLLTKAVSMQKGEEWKQTRSVLTPTFSALKMKKMMPLINQAMMPLLMTLEKLANEKKKFEAKNAVWGNFTMDVVASTMFGLQTDSQTTENNSFVAYAKRAFQFAASPLFFIIFTIPELAPILRRIKISTVAKDVVDFFVNTTKQVLNIRRKDDQQYHDFMGLMLKAHVNEEQKTGTGAPTKKEFTDTDILANALIFFLAGYETTASLLSWSSYSLAAYPECQERLQEEIDRVIGDKEVTYDLLNDMPYLDQILHESLRLNPPVVRFDRVASEDYEFEYNGRKMTILKGMAVQVPVWYMHYNEEWWDEPTKFNPDRWSPEERDKRRSIEPYIYVPFGVGPRNCIGMRFAQMEAKAALVEAFRKFNFKMAPDNKGYANPATNRFDQFGFHYPKDGLELIVEKRF